MLEVAIRKQLPQFTLDVAFRAGNEVVAIFGPSGSGKSLTLQCIAGLVRPDTGRIAVNGKPVYDSSAGLNVRPRDRRIGYVFQNYALFPHMTVLENIRYGINRLPEPVQHERVKRMIDVMRLDGLNGRRPEELSGGQQQRVALARALVAEPDLLLLDEPFSALDSPIRSRLHGELSQLLRSLSITAVLVTHNLSEAYTLSRTMVVYDAGHVLQMGPRDEVLHRPSSRAVARFTATKNIFRGKIIARHDDRMEVQTGAMVAHTRPGPYEVGDALDFCIRPEEIMLIRPERAVGESIEENQYPGEIVGEIAHGTSFTLQVKLTGDPLRSGREFDLHVDLPANVYYRLGLDTKKDWVVSLKKQSLHVIGPASQALDDR